MLPIILNNSCRVGSWLIVDFCKVDQNFKIDSTQLLLDQFDPTLDKKVNFDLS